MKSTNYNPKHLQDMYMSIADKLKEEGRIYYD